jgi:glycosyltransferase involved in cell wall biosynthesis
VPVLATLHLPRTFYPEQWFLNVPSSLAFNCVSQAQFRTFADQPQVIGVVPNGIALEKFPVTSAKENYVLWLGRICEEKAPHLAIAAAQAAGVPLVLAGQVYPFSYHQQYFKREIESHITDATGASVQFVDSPSLATKLVLLSRARAVILTSTAEETSSLVAMEAMACGTPVIAFRRGAFPEIVSDGETGFVVDSVEQMTAAILRSHEISARGCRKRVESRFAAPRMAHEYLQLYRQILEGARRRNVA